MAKRRPTSPPSTKSLSETLHVRVSDAMAKRLKEDAKALEMSESDALRQGLDLVHRLAQRKANIHKLLGEVDIKGDPGKWTLR